MRIDPKSLSEILPKTIEAARSEPAQAVGPAAGPPPAAIEPDRAVLSAQATQIQHAEQALGQVAEVRAEKVAEAKRMITEGTLELDTERIAGRIVAGGP